MGTPSQGLSRCRMSEYLQCEAETGDSGADVRFGCCGHVCYIEMVDGYM